MLANDGQSFLYRFSITCYVPGKRKGNRKGNGKAGHHYNADSRETWGKQGHRCLVGQRILQEAGLSQRGQGKGGEPGGAGPVKITDKQAA